MYSEPKYGKLAAGDIAMTLQLLPQFEQQRQELQALIDEKPEKFVEKFLTTGFAWAHLYEAPFLQFLSSFLAVAGLDGVVAHVTAQEKPIKAMFDMLDESDEMEWTGGSGGKFTPGDFLGYLQALVGNLDCLLIYGSYLSDLLAQARQGDQEALLNAIRIDPSVVTGRTASVFISSAVVLGDGEFLADLRKAMAGKTKKQAAYLQKFRFLMQVLHEADALGLPTKDISKLVFEVGAYARSPGAEKNVSELIRKAKKLKENAISK